MITANTTMPIAHTIGNATSLMRVASPIAVAASSAFPLADCGELLTRRGCLHGCDPALDARRCGQFEIGSFVMAIATATNWVYDFNEGSRDMRVLLNGKGAGIAEMTRVLGPDLSCRPAS